MAEVLHLGPDGWQWDGQPWFAAGPLYGVVGDPVAHSLSPAMQMAAIRERDLDAVYHSMQVAAEQLPHLKDLSSELGLTGFNVTAPHKEAVARLCDGRTDQARTLGAVNTVKVQDGRWLGHNTDSGGILAVLSQAWGDEPPPRAVVLGGGGAARAAIDALLRWPVPSLVVRIRSATGRDRLARWLTRRGDTAAVVLEPLVRDSEPTPDEPAVWLGCLAGGVPVLPYLPTAAGSARAFYLDLRYGVQRPAEDLPLGFTVSDGLPLLLMQGGLSFAWWFGPPVPWVAMRAALQRD